MRHQTNRRALLLLVLGLIPLAAVAGAAPTATATRAIAAPPPTPADALTERWGVEVVSLRRTAAGNMLDFRYRVLDATKAAPIFTNCSNPVLVDESTGAVMGVPSPPKTGPLRSLRPPMAGKTYAMFFANPEKFIQAGSKVTIVIGDFRVQGVVVE